MTRAAIFDAVRAAVPGVFNDPGNIHALDNLLDAFGVAREGDRRQINQAGLDLIKSFEGRELKAYRDPVGILTVGYGSTGPHVREGMVLTEDEAEGLLRKDLERFEAAVAKLCPVATDNQFSAMVCLAFNIGEGDGGFKTSTLRRLHNEGNYEGAADQFVRWNKAGGRVLKGLVRRRAAEADLYRKPA